MAAAPGISTRSRLAELARRRAQAGAEATPAPAEERCELCGDPIDSRHRHLLDLRSRELLCACRACSLLFDREAAGGDHFKLVPERVRRLEGFELAESAWESLRIPVEIAFFFFDSAEGRTVAFYPSPMGPTESRLGLEAWAEVEAANPVLATAAADVEALLVDRTRPPARQWLVPITECYRLVATIRLGWKGLGGGKEVWSEIGEFFAELEGKASAGAAMPAGGS